MSGGAKSKRKGNSGELELCKMLGKALGGSFIRSNNSGAFVGGKNVFRKAVLSANQTQSLKGDIVPPDHLTKLVVECKNYSEFRFHQLLQPGPCKQLDEWIKQTLDIVDEGDVMLVCFKISRTGWFVAVPEVDCPDYLLGNHCVYEGAHGKFRVTDLARFLEDNREAILRKAR